MTRTMTKRRRDDRQTTTIEDINVFQCAFVFQLMKETEIQADPQLYASLKRISTWYIKPFGPQFIRFFLSIFIYDSIVCYIYFTYQNKFHTNMFVSKHKKWTLPFNIFSLLSCVDDDDDVKVNAICNVRSRWKVLFVCE